MKSPITSHVPLIWPSSSWMSVRCGCRKAWGGMCVILIFLRPALRGFDSCSRQSVIFVTWGAIPWEVEADDWAECVEKTLVNNDAATCYFRPFRFLFAGRGHLRKPDCPPVPCNWRERPTDKKKRKQITKIHGLYRNIHQGTDKHYDCCWGDDEDSSELVVVFVIALEFSFPGNLRSILFAQTEKQHEQHQHKTVCPCVCWREKMA